MGNKNRVFLKLADATSLGASFQSKGLNCEGLDDVALQVITTHPSGSNDAVGQFSVVGSNNSLLGLASTDGDWTELATSPAIPPEASADRSFWILVPLTGVKFIALKYVRTSGGSTTVVNCHAGAKEV